MKLDRRTVLQAAAATTLLSSPLARAAGKERAPNSASNLLWYDKPAAYQGEPEVEFFRVVPTVWDETRVIDGRIGEYAIEARRSGDDWFVGAINNQTPKTLKLPLGFLAPGAKYVAHRYADDETVATRTHVRVSTSEVEASSVLELPLVASGGEAIWLTPVKSK